MHYQTPPHQEAKLVRCAAGAILDVAIDLRRDSPSFKTWVSVELSAENRRMLYVPEGCAHGYLTLTDETEIFYHASAEYAPQFGGGVRWNDPAFAVEWPFAPVVLNALAALDAHGDGRRSSPCHCVVLMEARRSARVSRMG